MRGYLSLIGLGTMLAAVAWIVIVMSVNPYEAGLVGFILFYVTFAATLVGCATIGMTVIRLYMLRRTVLNREIRTAFRHAVLFTAIMVMSLLFSASGQFTFLHLIGLIAAAAIVEYFSLQLYRGKG